jgi:hypothetical protein
VNSFKQQLLRYWLAMNASAFDSASAACMTFVAASGAHAEVPGVAPFDLKQFALILAVAFGHGCMAYLKAHPIEKLFPPEIAVPIDNQELAAGTKGTQVTQELHDQGGEH